MKRPLIIAGICLLVFSVLFITIPQTKAHFVIASWDSDDGYGQGINAVYVYENSTGSWLPILDPAYILPSEEGIISVNATGNNTALKMVPTYTLNHTLLNVASIDDGKAIIRGDIEVSCIGSSVYSQQNLTMTSGGNQTATTWWYSSSVIIPVILVAGSVYVVELSYYIYFYDP